MKYSGFELDNVGIGLNTRSKGFSVFTEDGFFYFDVSIGVSSLLLRKAYFLPLDEATSFFKLNNADIFTFFRPHSVLVPEELIQSYDMHSVYSLVKDVSPALKLEKYHFDSISASMLTYAPPQVSRFFSDVKDYTFFWLRHALKNYLSSSYDVAYAISFIFNEYLTVLVLHQGKIKLFNHFYVQTLSELWYQLHGALQTCSLDRSPLRVLLTGDLTTTDERLQFLRDRGYQTELLLGVDITDERLIPFSSVFWGLRDLCV